MSGGHRLDDGDAMRRRPGDRVAVQGFLRVVTSISTRCRRVAGWWRVRGRRGLLVAMFSALVALIGLELAQEDAALITALDARGLGIDAVVARIDRAARGNDVTTVVVRFPVGGEQVSAELGIVDGVPDDIGEGQRLRVVYDPQDPSQVLRPDQIDFRRVTEDYVMAGLGGAGVLCGTAWWAVRRRFRPPDGRQAGQPAGQSPE